MSKIVADNISPRGSDVTIAGVGTFSSSGVNLTGVVTATSFVGNVTGNATGLSGSPTLSGITSVSTSNLTVNGNAYPATGPLSNRNLIINGSMQVYQRSGISTNIVGYHLDRWELGASGGTRAVTQETLTTGSPYDEGFRNYFHLINTGTATGASDYRQIMHKIEAQNVAQSGWNYTSSASSVTLSFWVRASVAQTYYVQLYTPDGTAQNYGTSFSLSADTWTKVTKIIPGNSNITFNNDNGLGLQIIFVPFYGTDFTDSGFTTDAWNAYSGSSLLPDMTNTWAGTTNATFDITGVQLEVGSVATPFEHRSFGDELLRCQRYYQLHSYHGVVGQGQNTDRNSGSYVSFFVPMRTTPSTIAKTYDVDIGDLNIDFTPNIYTDTYGQALGWRPYRNVSTTITRGDTMDILANSGTEGGSRHPFNAEL